MAILHKIKNMGVDIEFTIDEQISLATICRTLPAFFRTPHGKRESYIIYRGFIIVRNTVQFTGCKPERRTVIYLYALKSNAYDDNGKPDTYLVDNANNIREAKQMIDKIIAIGQYD